jgi:hypothetical protein
MDGIDAAPEKIGSEAIPPPQTGQEWVSCRVEAPTPNQQSVCQHDQEISVEQDAGLNR